MVRYQCTLNLVRRLWPVVDGEHYHGEILRFRLLTEAGPDVPPPSLAEHVVELRIGGTLLARPAWDALTVREVALHGMAYVRERIQRDGLPEHSPTTYILNEHTDGGAYLEGSPFASEQLLAGRSFAVDAPHVSPDRVLQAN